MEISPNLSDFTTISPAIFPVTIAGWIPSPLIGATKPPASPINIKLSSHKFLSNTPLAGSGKLADQISL